MHLLTRGAWCVVSGLGTSLAFPPQDFAWVAWVGLVPWLVSLHRLGWHEAALLSAVFGLALALPLGAWIPGVVTDGFGGSVAGGYALWLLAGSTYVPAIVLLAVGLRMLDPRSALYPLAAGFGCALVELSYSFVWPQVPWVLLGATQIDTPVAPLAALFGVHGVSAVLVATNTLLAQALLRSSPIRTAAFAVGIAIAALLPGALAIPGPPVRPTIRVALVQPALPMRAHFDSVQQDESAAKLIELSRGLGEVDLVLWPENALAATLEGRPDLTRLVADLANQIGAPIRAGVHRSDSGSRFNSVALFAPGKPPKAIYDKARLLPFAEHIPAWLPHGLRGALGSLVPPVPFEPGELNERIEPRATFFLCFESAFSGEWRNPEAEVLVNLVNDGWYDRTAAAEHLLLLSRWRAIEAGAPLLRVASTGISAVILPTGKIDGSLSVGKAGTLIREVPLRASVTVFERLGYAPLLFGAGLTWALALSQTRAGANRASPRSTP